MSTTSDKQKQWHIRHKTVRLLTETHEALSKIGTINETYDDLIARLIKEHHELEQLRNLHTTT